MKSRFIMFTFIIFIFCIVLLFCSDKSNTSTDTSLSSSSINSNLNAGKNIPKDNLEPLFTNLEKLSGRGKLLIKYSPLIARIYINGRLQISRHPFKKTLRCGKHDLQIVHENYNIVHQLITIEENKETNLEINLEKRTLKDITIYSEPSDGILEIDGTQFGSTPVTIKTINYGKHWVKVSKIENDNKYLFSSEYDFNSINNSSITINLQPWKESETMEYISGRTYTMSAATETDLQTEKDLFPHKVQISPFMMDKTEVTNKEFEAVMPEYVRGKYSQKDNSPASGVTWFEANSYCNKINKRLPTEAEWEYAARGPYMRVYGTIGPITMENANVARRENDALAVDVGSYPPNDFGLHDMSGNVKEWVYDWYDENYFRVSEKKDPIGPESGVLKVAKGGCWWDRGVRLPVYYRDKQDPNVRNYFTGFRCAQDVPTGLEIKAKKKIIKEKKMEIDSTKSIQEKEKKPVVTETKYL